MITNQHIVLKDGLHNYYYSAYLFRKLITDTFNFKPLWQLLFYMHAYLQCTFLMTNYNTFFRISAAYAIPCSVMFLVVIKL